MAAKYKSMEDYLQCRVSELLKASWPEHEIVQQLEAVVGREAVKGEIKKQKLASTH